MITPGTTAAPRWPCCLTSRPPRTNGRRQSQQRRPSRTCTSRCPPPQSATSGCRYAPRGAPAGRARARPRLLPRHVCFLSVSEPLGLGESMLCGGDQRSPMVMIQMMMVTFGLWACAEVSRAPVASCGRGVSEAARPGVWYRAAGDGPGPAQRRAGAHRGDLNQPGLPTPAPPPLPVLTGHVSSFSPY